MAALHDVRSERGLQSNLIGADKLFGVEPELSGDLVGGLLVDEDVQVDPRRLLRALVRAVRSVRARLVTETEVSGGTYDETEGVWRLDISSQPSISARNVILTAGPWCDQIVESASGSPLAETGVGPVKGQLLRMRGPRVIDRVVRTTDLSMAQRRSGELIVASTKEPEAGWDLTPTGEARETLLERASSVLLRVAELELVEHSVGLRPALPDHLPVIGSGGRPGLFVATGHFQHGILLAPSTAYWIAEAMDSEDVPEMIAHYAIDRLAHSTLRVTLNGDDVSLTQAALTDALCELGYDPEQPGIAVAVNMSVVPRSEWDSTTVTEGDRIDIVGARQGG